MSDEYKRQTLTRTLEYERGTWREALRSRGGVWFEALTWGFQCHDGWREIIESLTEELIEITGGPEGAPGARVVQVKQKFGLLRYYFWHVPKPFQEAVSDAIGRAEERSATTCEVCGEPGKLISTSGYWHVACPEHENPKSYKDG